MAQLTEDWELDILLNRVELAEAVGVTPRTISEYRSRGYRFEFQTLTTPRHFLAWLAEYKKRRPRGRPKKTPAGPSAP